MKRFISALCVFLSLMTICSFAMAAEPIGSEFHDDRIWYLDRNSGLYGYLDTKGNVAIKSQFKTSVDFSDASFRIMTKAPVAMATWPKTAR